MRLALCILLAVLPLGSFAQSLSDPAFVASLTSIPSSLTTNLTAYWTLNETSGNRADSVGSSTLTPINAPTSFTGVVGNAALFAFGSSQALYVADNTALSTGDIDFTIATWVKMLAWREGINQTIACKELATNAAAFADFEWTLYLQDVDKKFVMFVSNGVTGGSVASAAISTNVWNLVVAYHDSVNNLVGISLNGGAPVTAAYSGGSFDSTHPFLLGGRFPSNQSDSIIDETGFWKRVLTSDERTTIYNSGAGRTYPFTQ